MQPLYHKEGESNIGFKAKGLFDLVREVDLSRVGIDYNAAIAGKRPDLCMLSNGFVLDPG